VTSGLKQSRCVRRAAKLLDSLSIIRRADKIDKRRKSEEKSQIEMLAEVINNIKYDSQDAVNEKIA
jgi:hypothetical protein